MTVLFHGSTAGWIHISGFKQNDYSYGELNSKASFMYLCTKKAGADFAASIAFQRVRGRNEENDPPVEPYTRYGFIFRFAPYLYKVSFPNDIKILDFGSTSLSKKDKRNVNSLMHYGRMKKCQINNQFLRCIVSLLIKADLLIQMEIFKKKWNKEWSERLNESFHEKYGFVEFAPAFGFNIVKNLHGEGGYDEVWALPIASFHRAEIDNPEVLPEPK